MPSNAHAHVSGHAAVTVRDVHMRPVTDRSNVSVACERPDMLDPCAVGLGGACAAIYTVRRGWQREHVTRSEAVLAGSKGLALVDDQLDSPSECLDAILFAVSEARVDRVTDEAVAFEDGENEVCGA